MKKQWKLDLNRGDFVQFEADHKKEREKQRLEEEVQKIEQQNAEIVAEIDELQALLEINRLAL